MMVMNISNELLDAFASANGRAFVRYCYSPKNVLWGEGHGDATDLNPQKEFIEYFRPAVVLHELMGISIYDPKTGREYNRRKEGKKSHCEEDAREIINKTFKEMADVYGFLLVGCDLTLGERECLIGSRGSRHLTEDEIKRKLEEMGRPKGPFGSHILDLAEKERHEEMAKVYEEYRNIESGALMITGLQHVRGSNPPDWEASDFHELVGQPDYGVIENRLNVRIRELALAFA